MNEILVASTRATGIVAVALVALALVWGLAFTSRETGRRLRPAWWLDLHNWLGGAALVFTVVHVGLAVVSAQGPGWAAALVPFVSRADRVGFGVGVAATYLLAAAVLTTWPRRLGSRRWWRMIHVASLPAAVLAGVHTLQVGSDAGTGWLRGGLVAVAAPVAYLTGVRVAGAVGSLSSKRNCDVATP